MVMCPVGFRALRTTLERTVVDRFGYRLVDHDGIVATEKSLQLNCGAFPGNVRTNERSEVVWSKGG